MKALFAPKSQHKRLSLNITHKGREYFVLTFVKVDTSATVTGFGTNKHESVSFRFSVDYSTCSWPLIANYCHWLIRTLYSNAFTSYECSGILWNIWEFVRILFCMLNSRWLQIDLIDWFISFNFRTMFNCYTSNEYIDWI